MDFFAVLSVFKKLKGFFASPKNREMWRNRERGFRHISRVELNGTKVRDDCTGLKVATACSSAETRLQGIK